jgi:sugar phosphate isomerase/epimerase
MTPISLQLYALRESAEVDLPGTLKKIADIGYMAIETAGLHGKQPAEVKKMLDDVGLVMSSAHIPNLRPETVPYAIEMCKAMDFNKVQVGTTPTAFKTLDGIKGEADRIQEIACMLKPHDIILGVHNYYNEFDPIDGRYPYDYLMDQTPDIYCEIDMYWASNFGKTDVPAVISKYKHRVRVLHVKDGPLTSDEAPQTAVGKGKMNIPACINATDPNVLEWLVVELDDCATDMLEAVRDSYIYLTSNGFAKGNK